MSYDPNDLVRCQTLFSESIAEVFPRLQKAVIQVPNRGTLIKSCDRLLLDKGQNSFGFHVNRFHRGSRDHHNRSIKAAIWRLQKKTERDSLLHDFQWELAMWIHHGFYEQLKVKGHIFRREQE